MRILFAVDFRCSNAFAHTVIIAIFCFSVLNGIALGQTRSDFALETIAARPGEKVSGYVEVPAGSDAGTRIPVTVIHGAKNGKVMVIMSGIHGSEYSPILALQRLRERIDPKKLSGTIILVHVANMPSFLKRTIYYGSDGKNLNRVFPGKAEGTITERIAYVLVEKIFKRCDILIDVHSGDNNESLRPYVAYYEREGTPPELIETGRRLALASGIDFVKKILGRSGQLASSTYTTNTALILGKATIAIESGELGEPHEADIARSENGLLNILRELTMLPGKPVKFRNQLFVKRDETVRSEKTGLFYPLVKKDQRVRAGQKIGYVTDFFGNKVQNVVAPFLGVVMYFTATPAVSEGEPLVNIGELETAKNKKSRD